MKVLKFGGTSVANAKNIKLVLDIVLNKAKKDKLIVVGFNQLTAVFVTAIF
jgi:aspartokinase/homoserine dehydrogenase 1